MYIEIVHILTSLGQKGVADGGPTATWQAGHKLIRFVFPCSFQRCITRYQNNFQSMFNWFFLYWLLIIEIVHILTSLGQKGVADWGPNATWKTDHRLIRFVFSCSLQRYITQYQNNFQSMLNWIFYIECILKSFTFWRHRDKKEWLMGVQPQRDKLIVGSFDSSFHALSKGISLDIEIFFRVC